MTRVDRLPRVVDAAPGRPSRGGAADTRRDSRRIAEGTATWSAQRAREVRSRYAELAGSWDRERGGYRHLPLADALDRGGSVPSGPCLEIGSGTGLLTPLIRRVWPRVACLDLTPEMLSRSTAPWRLIGDASRLPFRDGVAAAVVLADVPLFAAEIARVLAPDGVVVWSNALGTEAPHHVPTEVVLDALDRVTPGRPWRAVASEAGWGSWAVCRR
ncbi:MAG: class I SAM-dependent methyltransferase [Actinocatenispora sp.]